MSSSVTARAATFAQVLRRVFRLAAPYFRSEEKWRARAMLLGIVALNLLYVYVAVLGNQWYGRFYDALQNKDAAVFWREVGVFGWIAFFNIAVQVLKFYVTQLLQLRWRTWMTRDYLSRWMADRTFYHLELARYAGNDGHAPDNPDQRIQEDMQLFTDYTMTLSMGLLNAVVTLVSFVGILWTLSGSFDFSVGGSTYQIAGAMVWLAVAYCVVGTVITHFIGRPLIGINFRQQRFEADFRHHLVRVREYSEAIALDKGEKVEHGQLDMRFGSVLRNYLQLIKQQKNLITFTSFFGQAAVIFPFLVAAPRFFSGAIHLGQLMQISSAFGKVQDSLSWFVDNYDRVAIWRATTDRLTSFDDAMRAHARQSMPMARDAGAELRTDDLCGAARRHRPAERRRAGGEARRQRAAAGSFGQRQVDAVPLVRRHLAVRARPCEGAGGRDVHAAAPLRARRQAARRTHLPQPGRRLQRRPAAPGPERRPASRPDEPARRERRLEPEAVGRRTAAPRHRARAAEEAGVAVRRRDHQRARCASRRRAVQAPRGHGACRGRCDGVDRAPRGGRRLPQPALDAGAAGRRRRRWCALPAQHPGPSPQAAAT